MHFPSLSPPIDWARGAWSTRFGPWQVRVTSHRRSKTFAPRLAWAQLCVGSSNSSRHLPNCTPGLPCHKLPAAVGGFQVDPPHQDPLCKLLLQRSDSASLQSPPSALWRLLLHGIWTPGSSTSSWPRSANPAWCLVIILALLCLSTPPLAESVCTVVYSYFDVLYTRNVQWHQAYLA